MPHQNIIRNKNHFNTSVLTLLNKATDVLWSNTVLQIQLDGLVFITLTSYVIMASQIPGNLIVRSVIRLC